MREFKKVKVVDLQAEAPGIDLHKVPMPDQGDVLVISLPSNIQIVVEGSIVCLHDADTVTK